MDREKFDLIIQYFNDLDIALPTEVKNAIEDVFNENDFIDSVDCYHKNDLEAFQKDMTIKNEVKMFINGQNIGHTTNVFTYYGSLTYGLSEAINLYDENGQVLEDISNFDNPDETVVDIPNDYCVVVLERVDWDSDKKEFSRKPHMYIYCPESDEADEYADIKNKIKNGEL